MSCQTNARRSAFELRNFQSDLLKYTIMKSKISLSVFACLLVIVVNSCKHTTDITNAVLTNMSPDCSSYEGYYCAKVTDVQRGNKKFTANLQIKCTPSKCIFKTDGIPNHNFDDGPVRFSNDVSEQSKT